MAGINATRKNILKLNKRMDRALLKEIQNSPYFDESLDEE